ncbi:putative apyrase [Helianthus anomalus]
MPLLMSLLQVQFYICYLNYGLLETRAEILGVAKDADNPCILTGYNGVYTYGGIDYKVSAPSSGSSMSKCRKEVLKALKVNESTCTYTKCTFNGVWNGGGGDGQNNMYVGFINVSERVVEVRPQDFKEAAKHACKTTFEDAKSTYPNVDADDLPCLCMDLVYQYTLASKWLW